MGGLEHGREARGLAVALSRVDAAVIEIHQASGAARPRRRNHGSAAGVYSGEMVAAHSAQPKFAAVEGRSTVQARRDRDERAVSPEALVTKRHKQHKLIV